MNYFFVPITQQTINGRTANAPKYYSTDMSGLGFTSIPYGAEPIGIFALQNANAALSAETDVFSFPADLTQTLADADVSALSTFLTAANVPVDQITSGLTFGAVLQIIAKIFLVAQAVAGATGSAIFTSGITVASAVSDTNVANVLPTQTATLGGGTTGAVGVGGSGSGSSGGASSSAQVGPFDFSDVDPSDTVGATLNAVAQQFNATVIL